MIKILEKRKFIQKYRKELNGQNPYALKYRERARLKIERKVALKFLIVTIMTFIFICLSNYFFNNPINDWVASIYVKYINFPLSDEDSARYFFSAVPQSLAALLAISFTVLLIYLQISVDRYSIQTVRYVFHGWGAVTVLSIFLTTIIYSFFELCNIRNMGVTAFPWDCAIYTTFILTTLCGLLLILFFYKTISSLTPENFIRQSGERIRKASIVSLDFTQLILIKNIYFKNKINDMENVEEPHFFKDFGSSDSNRLSQN